MLTTAEHDGYLDLGALFQEADNIALFGLIVMVVNFWTKLLLLDDGLLLILLGLTGFLGLFVLELAVVHDLCDRWLCVRRNLN